MEQQNTTLDDISSVIGFTATLRLSAWYGNGNNLYVPEVVEDDQVLVRLLGRSVAERLAQSFGREWLSVPRITSYEEDMRRQRIGSMLEKGFSTREVARHERMSERRVQQTCRELELIGLIAPVGLATRPVKTKPATSRKKPVPQSVGKTGAAKPPEKSGSENPLEKGQPNLLKNAAKLRRKWVL